MARMTWGLTKSRGMTQLRDDILSRTKGQWRRQRERTRRSWGLLPAAASDLFPQASQAPAPPRASDAHEAGGDEH